MLGFSNCEGSKSKNTNIKLVQDPPFSIGEIYSQDWISGVKGGGSGTNLFIKFTDLSEEINIHEFYFRDKIVNARVSSQNRNEYTGFYKNTINKEVIMNVDPVKESQNKPPYKTPFQLDKNEAVISYLYKGELVYYKVVGIEEKPLIAYPMTNQKKDQ